MIVVRLRRMTELTSIIISNVVLNFVKSERKSLDMELKIGNYLVSLRTYLKSLDDKYKGVKKSDRK